MGIKSKQDKLSAEDIRRIRESLGLSRAEAGELLGGGPRAFTKYENGTIKPAASVVNLLRLLEGNPGALATLTGRKPVAAHHDATTSPFEITGQHVAALTDRKFANLVRRLLSAEAHSADLPKDGIHVAAVITAPDAGEDARIEWSGGSDRTAYLPSRLCVFQLKASAISPAEAGAEVLNSTGKVQPMIQHALEAGGTYIMLCTRSYTDKEIKKREARILRALTDAGISVPTTRIQFRDADQIADWVNAHPAVATWLLEQTQPGLLGPFRDWSHWASRHEHETSLWVNDSRLPEFQNKVRALITPPRGVARVVGLSGIGKSRLTLEALSATAAEENFSPRLSDLVLYAVESDVGSTAVKTVVQSLGDSGVRAVVVVDRCMHETHQDLAAMVKRPGSRLSLVTIDHEIPLGPNLPGDSILIERADEAVIDAMLNHIAPNLPDDDHRRLVKFAAGFPHVARMIGHAWLNDVPIASASDETLIDRIILGRNPHEPTLLRDAAKLLGAFGLLGVRPPLDSDLVEVAKLSRGRTPDDLRAAFDELGRRTVVQQRGRLVTLQPRPIALSLAERQWHQWDPKRWDEILTGRIPEHLRKRAADQLSLLDRRSIAHDVTRHVCRLNGPLASFEGLSREANSEVLSSLAEVDPEIVVTLLEHVLHALTPTELQGITGEVRRHLVWALEKIAFVARTFERGAALLLDLAVAENETWGNNATGQFKSLFPVLLADTEAAPEARLRVIDEVIASESSARLSIAVDALFEGAKMDFFSRSVGSEIQGSRPALKPWAPKVWKDAWDYVKECSNRLATIATRSDEVGARARAGLGRHFRMYVGRGLIDDVERWTAEVTAVHAYWPQALESLGDFLQFDVAEGGPGVEMRVRQLISKLTPNDLASRVRFLVTEMPWDYPVDEKLDFDEQRERQVKAVDDLVGDLLEAEDALTQFLPQLSRGDQRMAAAFGRSLAKRAKNPLSWRVPIMEAVKSVPSDERNFALMAGYFAGLVPGHEDALEEFKQMAAEFIDLAPALPLVCWSAGIREADIELVRKALHANLIPPFALMQWTLGGELAKLQPAAVAPLFTEMLKMEQPFYSIALDLMGMYVHGKKDRLDGLRSQLRLAASLVSRRQKRTHGSQMDAHHFERLMKWLLSKGCEDPDARGVALMLAKQLVADPAGEGQELIKPLLPILLADFSHIVWPLIGQAVVADNRKAWLLQLQLGGHPSFVHKPRPPILSLPEDMLFAWCHAHPDAAPAFVASVIPMLTTRDPEASSREFHPLVKRLLDEFGERGDVLEALVGNMHTFGWSGSRTTYYALYEQPLMGIENHPVGAVRRWVQQMLSNMRRAIESARDEDEEQRAHWGV